MENELTRYTHFDEETYHAFNLAVTSAIDLFPSHLADAVMEKLDSVPDYDYDVWVAFTEDEYACLASLVEIGIKEFGEDGFTEEELSILNDLVENAK